MKVLVYHQILVGFFHSIFVKAENKMEEKNGGWKKRKYTRAEDICQTISQLDYVFRYHARALDVFLSEFNTFFFSNMQGRKKEQSTWHGLTE